MILRNIKFFKPLIPLNSSKKNILSVTKKYLTHIKLYFINCVILFSFFSCTTNRDVSTNNIIQKRKYRKGFYVNIIHHKKKKTLINNKEYSETYNSSITFKDSAYEHFSENKNVVLASSNFETDISTIIKYEKNQHLKRTITAENYKQNFTSSINQKKSSPKIFPKKNKSKDNEPVKNEFIGALSCVIGILAFAFVFNSFFNIVLYSVFSFDIMLPILAGIAAVVLGIVSLRKIKNSLTNYKGKGFAIFGLIIGLLSLYLGFSLLLLLSHAS